MSKKLPSNIVQKVVKCYLETPLSLGRIAKTCGLSKTSVFNIVQAKGGEDPDFLLMHHLVVNLDKRGVDVPTYAYGIRIQKLLEEYGVDKETGESMMEELLTTCYRLNWNPREAIFALKRFNDCAREHNMTPNQYQSWAIREMGEFRKWHTLVNQEKEKLGQFKEKNLLSVLNLSLVTSTLLPDRLKLLQKARLYESKYFELLKDTKQNRKLRVDPKNLKNLNDKMRFGNITEEHVLEKIDAIARHPEEFSFLFDDEALAILNDPEEIGTDEEVDKSSESVYTDQSDQITTGNDVPITENEGEEVLPT